MLNSESTNFFHQSFIFLQDNLFRKKQYKKAYLADFLGPHSVTKKPTWKLLEKQQKNVVKKIRENI